MSHKGWEYLLICVINSAVTLKIDPLTYSGKCFFQNHLSLCRMKYSSLFSIDPVDEADVTGLNIIRKVPQVHFTIRSPFHGWTPKDRPVREDLNTKFCVLRQVKAFLYTERN